jgi:DNA repair exonuclease SbcCD ATPase subunit
MDIESDQLLWLVLAATTITLLFAALVIAARARQIREQLLELDALKRSMQAVQRDIAEIVRISDRTFIGLRELSGFGLHFRQIKREQSRLSEKLRTISSAMETFAGLLQPQGETRREHQDEISEIVEAFRSLQEWRSRMTAVYSDAGHLFESEPIRELIDRFGPPPPSHTAEPPNTSEGRSRSSQKRVRPRRQG